MLGLAPSDVEPMQLMAYDQLAFELGGLRESSAIAATRATVKAGWVWLAGASFAPFASLKQVESGASAGESLGTQLASDIGSTSLVHAKAVVAFRASGTGSMDQRQRASQLLLTGVSALAHYRAAQSAAQI